MTRFAVSLVLAAGVLCAPAALAHPDLLAQIERLDERLLTEPGNIELLMRRGDLYRRHQDYDAAAGDFAAARALPRKHTQLDFYEGRLALELGDFDSASILLHRYLTAHPDDPVGWRLLGESAQGRGEDSAADSFQRAIANSKTPSPELYRQWALACLAVDDRDGALQAVDAGLARFGAEVTLLGLGTDIALAERNAQLAEAYLEQLPVGLERLAPWFERHLALNALSDVQD